MGRAPCCDKANVKKGPWSPEEDAKLKAYIQEHGTGGNWIALPQKIGLKRCGKSCRLRWLNYLRPNIKHGGFSEEEDNIICTLFLNIGSRWSIIAAQLPGRTDNDIKNYWNTKLKKKLIGKQRKAGQTAIREMVLNRDITKIETNFVENMMNPSLYYPELPEHVPSLYPSLDDHNNDQYPIMRGKLYHDHQQPNINNATDGTNFEYPFEYFSPYEDLVYENSMNSLSSTNSMSGDFSHFPNMYQGLNYQTYNNQLESCLFGANIINCTSGTSSVESSSRGDISSMVYDPSMGVQDCVFQEPKCFGVQ